MLKSFLNRTVKGGLPLAAVMLLSVGWQNSAYCQNATQWWQGTQTATENANSRVVELQMEASGKRQKKMTLNETFKPDQSIRFLIRFTTEEAKNASASFMTGNGLERLHLNAQSETERIYWNIRDSEGQIKRTPWIHTTYLFNSYAQRDFAWSDDLLQWTEHYLAQNKPLDEKWVELKYVIRQQRCQVYLDGILLDEWEPHPTLFENYLAINTSANVTIKPAVIKGLPPENILYHPVDIGHRVNASEIDGQKISPKTLPSGNEHVVINSIPFEFPRAGEDGENNIDVGKSWFRAGNLTGHFSPRSGSLAGRWYGAFNASPTRIQFRTPNRQFDAVYVIAAAANTANSIPKVTVQFYKPSSGFPKNFESPPVPAFAATGSSATKLPVKTMDGTNRNLWLIKIPVNPGALQEFSDLNYIEFELTKQVQLYRCYSDPSYYSQHGAGLPSSVHIFALTLGVAPIKVEFSPDRYANIWTTPEKPSYTVDLLNRSATDEKIELELATKSYDGKEEVLKSQTITIKSGESTKAQFEVDVERFGWHNVELVVKNGTKTQTFSRSLAFLRKQDHQPRKYDDDGYIFGFWNWAGGHLTPSVNDSLRIIGPAGGKALHSGIYREWTDDETISLAEKYGIKSYLSFSSGESRLMGFANSKRHLGVDYDPKDPKLMREALLKVLTERYQEESSVAEPLLVRVFSEPGGIGNTHGTLPELHGQPEEEMTADEKARFEDFKERFLISVKGVKEKYPDTKILMPHGDPSFSIPFLKENGEVAKLMDGVAVDIGYFERLPEQQFHQCSIHRLKQFTDNWNQVKTEKPVLATFEGPCLSPVLPGALTEEEVGAHTFRAALLLAAYGVNRQFTSAAVADCSNYWGEQHYGGGLLSRINGLNPHVVYAVYATMARHLADFNFERWIPTGSLSVYCLQFKNNRTSENMYVMWTIRGEREIAMHVAKNSEVSVFDSMDNDIALKNTDGQVGLTVTKMPSLVYGAGDHVKIQLGAPDHSDSKLEKHHKLVMNCGQADWKQIQEEDEDYVGTNRDFIRRYPAEMKIKKVSAPAHVGDKALAVDLPEQPEDRGVMPFFTTLYPPKQIVFPGKAQYVSTWIKAASDWGRIIYVLRDAKDEKWISVGAKNKWNCDDTHGWSKFCYDGWRLLKFELPSHAPYDNYRENGTTWWGSSEGDGIVDLPLRLEKIIIERRPLAMYVNSLEETNPQAIEIADMYVEYATASDMTEKVIEESKIRMPKLGAKSKKLNPIAELAKKGTLTPSMITSVKPPESHYDGTRGVFSFKEMPQATAYDIWLSRNPDGTSAIKLGSKLLKSDILVRGFLADTDFYAFVVYYDKEGNTSKPSAPFKFRLEDMFGMK